MAIRFEFDRTNRILLARVDGRLNDESLTEVSQSIRRQLLATEARAGIFDFTLVTKFEVSSGFVQRLTRNGSAVFQPLPGIVVVPQTVAFGLACMFQIMTEQTRPHFSAVKTMEEALRVLKAEKAEFKPLDE